MAIYTITHKTEQNIPVEVTFPSWYKQGENEFIFFKSPNEVVRIDCDTRLRFYNITYTGFLSPDNIEHFVVSGRKSSQTEFMEAYHVVQDVLRDAFVSYKHLDKTLEGLNKFDIIRTVNDRDLNGLSLEYTQPRSDEFDIEEYKNGGSDFTNMEILGRI